MKFGICTTPEKAALLKPGTLDYIEMNLTNIAKMSDEDVKKAKALLESIGTPAEAGNCFFPSDLRLCGPRYDKKQVIEHTKRALDKAAALGIFTCVLGSGRSRNLEEGDDRESCLKQFEEAVATAGDIAKIYGTIIVLEPLRVAEANYLNTVAEGADLCRRIGHPNVLLLADYFHMDDWGEELSVLAANKDILRHTHIAAPVSRAFPLPEDGHDYKPFADALRAAGYNFRMSIECRNTDSFAEDATRSIAYLRQIFA